MTHEMSQHEKHIQRMHVHRHNSYHGTVMLMRSHLKRLSSARSFTHNAIDLVNEIDRLLGRLALEVWMYRRELDGQLKVVKHKSIEEHLGKGFS